MFPRLCDLKTAPTAVVTGGLQQLGFQNPGEALLCLIRLIEMWQTADPDAARAAESGEDPRWYDALERVVREAPLRDTVIMVIEQFVRVAREKLDVFAAFEQSPRTLEILARLACGSPFLTQILLSDPGCLPLLTLHGRTAEMKAREQFVAEAMAQTDLEVSRSARLATLRRYQRRQLLRIGMCDAFGLLDLRFVTLQLSLLADAMVQCCLNLAMNEAGVASCSLAVIALGKHGGEELNYSSDIDLVLIAEEDSFEIQRIARLTIDGLADNISPGFLYRVDLRLRPWGEAGPLVSTVSAYASYLVQDAAIWEKQAMLKARIVAGDLKTGREFMNRIGPLLFTGTATQVRASIQEMKERIEFRLRQRGKLNSEVKLGVGSIRDVEFLVQSLQLIHGEQEPRILSFNTLDSLVRLTEFGLISATWYRQLRAGYVFLRTVEHSLQLLHNQQIHELPMDRRQLEWLANRLDYPDADTLLLRFDEHRAAVRTIFDECVRQASRPPATDELATQERLPDSDAEALLLTESELAVRRERLSEMFALLDSGQTAVVRARLLSESDVATWELVVCGIDFSGWLAVICGLMSIYRLDIRNGDALTGEGTNRYSDRCVAGKFLACFEVQPAGPLLPETKRQNVNELAELLQGELARLGELSRTGRIEEMRAELLSRFCDAVPEPTEQVSESTDVEVELLSIPGSVLTQVNIRGADSWGFLYELANALSLSRFRVLRALINADHDQVRDVLYVRERNGRPIDSPERLQELKLAATLIKQFTHWLPSTSDPQHALSRFRDLVSRLEPESTWPDSMNSLRQPGVLYAVARVLGTSQYLWETFLQSRRQELFPLLANAESLKQRECRDSLELDLDRMLAECPDEASEWNALNEFKDRHLFRIDMRHVLGYCRPFGAFSEELTELAELTVARAIDISWRHLRLVYGEPDCVPCEGSCPWVMAGIGKFGGIELGFASDIELMLIYHSNGMTSGPSRISTASFFEQLINRVATGIRASRDGIFQVDLRMRPYGQAGSGAVSLEDFIQYYQSDGPAWPYERQAMVKLRCIAGHPQFGQQVIKACHTAIYSSGWFDFSSMRAMRERQIRQLVRGGSINAKLSDGGIVDCEYAIQALQLTFGQTLPALRYPNSLRVLQEASRYSLIDPQQSQQVQRAYVFLRELIDCLRMVRGNAKDLTIPNPGSADWHQLARRMRTIHDSEVELDQLEDQMRIVRDFSMTVEKHCRKLRQKPA